MVTQADVFMRSAQNGEMSPVVFDKWFRVMTPRLGDSLLAILMAQARIDWPAAASSEL